MCSFLLALMRLLAAPARFTEGSPGGRGTAWVPFSDVTCRLGLSQRRLGCRGWISTDPSCRPALERSSRRSLPTGTVPSQSGPHTRVPELCPSAAASVWKLDQNSDVPLASSPSFAGSGNRSWDMVIVWIFFLSAVVCEEQALSR